MEFCQHSENNGIPLCSVCITEYNVILYCNLILLHIVKEFC